jgi:hypothetical protein
MNTQDWSEEHQEVSVYREGFSQLLPGVFVTGLITGYTDRCELVIVWKSLTGQVLSELRYPNINLRIAREELNRQWDEYRCQNRKGRL